MPTNEYANGVNVDRVQLVRSASVHRRQVEDIDLPTSKCLSAPE